jgi:hypothetical protein
MLSSATPPPFNCNIVVITSVVHLAQPFFKAQNILSAQRE